MPGTRYTIGERLGAGGMAKVFRAALEGTQGFARPVAVTTEAATRIEDTCATAAPEGTTAPPQTTPTETPQAPAAAPPDAPPPAPRHPAPAAAERRAALPRIPIHRGSTLPTAFYVKETLR